MARATIEKSPLISTVYFKSWSQETTINTPLPPILKAWAIVTAPSVRKYLVLAMDDRIAQAYAFVMQQYRHGDSVYVFVLAEVRMQHGL